MINAFLKKLGSKKKSLTKGQKRLILGLALVALVMLFIVPELAGAQAATATETLDQAFKKVANLFQIFMRFLSMLLWPILFMIGGLIQNDILYDHGMEQLLLKVWIQVRNLVNVTFVVALLGIAFYNVIGIGEDAIKKFLPKLIIGIIAVNFTFIGAKVILDVTNVMTVSLFTMPQSIDPRLATINPTDPKEREKFEVGVCESIYGKGGATKAVVDKYLTNQARLEALNKVDKKLKGDALTNAVKKEQDALAANADFRKKMTAKILCLGDKFRSEEISKKLGEMFETYGPNNAALAMALSLQQTHQLQYVHIPGKFADFTMNILMSVILYIMYASSYIALFAVLVVRILVLWICIALSPLIVLEFFQISGISDQISDLRKQFTQHAIAPIVVAAVMTIGFIMMKSFQSATQDVGVGAGFNLDTETALLNIPTSGIDTFRQLLVAIATCAVIWIGVFSATKDTIAGGFTEGLKSTVGGVGKFLLKTPQYLPIIPIGKVGADGKPTRVSLQAALGGFQDLPGRVQNLSQALGGKSLEKQKQAIFGGALFGAGGASGSDLGKGIDLKALQVNAKAQGQYTAPAATAQKRIAARLKDENSKYYKDVLASLKANGIAQPKAFLTEFKAQAAKGKLSQANWQKFYKGIDAEKAGRTAAPPTTGRTAATRAAGTAATGAAASTTYGKYLDQKEVTTLKGIEAKEAAAKAETDPTKKAKLEGELKKLKESDEGKKVLQKVETLKNAKTENYTKQVVGELGKKDNQNAQTAAAANQAITYRVSQLKKSNQFDDAKIRSIIDKELTDFGVDDAAKRKSIIDKALGGQ